MCSRSHREPLHPSLKDLRPRPCLPAASHPMAAHGSQQGVGSVMRPLGHPCPTANGQLLTHSLLRPVASAWASQVQAWLCLRAWLALCLLGSAPHSSSVRVFLPSQPSLRGPLYGGVALWHLSFGVHAGAAVVPGGDRYCGHLGGRGWQWTPEFAFVSRCGLLGAEFPDAPGTLASV